jgi:hypothetical protein
MLQQSLELFKVHRLHETVVEPAFSANSISSRCLHVNWHMRLVFNAMLNCPTERG